MIEPAGHRVLVKVEEIESRTAGGIIVPETIREKQTDENIFGTIVAIGRNAWKAFDDGQPWAKVGDRISFAKYGGGYITDPITGEKFRVLNDEDVTTIIR